MPTRGSERMNKTHTFAAARNMLHRRCRLRSLRAFSNVSMNEQASTTGKKGCT
jgi:hypothetical protein